MAVHFRLNWLMDSARKRASTAPRAQILQSNLRHRALHAFTRFDHLLGKTRLLPPMPQSDHPTVDAVTRTQSRLQPSIIALVLAVLVGWLVMLPSSEPLFDSQGQPPASLRIGYAIEPPYAFLDANGELRGEAVDVMRQVLATTGIRNAEWVHVEFADLLHELKHGRLDVVAAGLFDTPERRTLVQFSRPTARVRAALLTRLDQRIPERLKDISLQTDFRVAVIDGSVEQAAVRAADWPKSRVLAVADAESGMQALQSGSVDLLALSLPSLRWQVRQLDQTALTHQIVELSDVRPGYPAFAFALENTAFKTRVDGALSSYIGSPAHVRLVQTYGFEWSDVVWPTPSEAFQE